MIQLVNTMNDLLKGRLDGSHRIRVTKLMNMLYTPDELAEELKISVNQVSQVYVLAGCPCERDTKQDIWINGELFWEWYEATYPRDSLGENKAFCVSCNKPVDINNPMQEKKKCFSYWVCICPKCGRKLARIISADGRQE